MTVSVETGHQVASVDWLQFGHESSDQSHDGKSSSSYQTSVTNQTVSRPSLSLDSNASSSAKIVEESNLHDGTLPLGSTY